MLDLRIGIDSHGAAELLCDLAGWRLLAQVMDDWVEVLLELVAALVQVPSRILAGLKREAPQGRRRQKFRWRGFAEGETRQPTSERSGARQFSPWWVAPFFLAPIYVHALSLVAAYPAELLVFASTVVRGRVYTDETGVFYEIPVLLTPNGPLESLADYLVANWDIRSPQWMLKVVQSVRFFLEYLDANPNAIDGRETFQNFRQRLLTGSIDYAAGSDPSGLWWKPRGPKVTNRIICNLTDFFTWWCDRNPGTINPAAFSKKNSYYDRRVAELAYEYRRNQAFLGHTWSSKHETSRRPSKERATQWHKPLSTEKDTPPAFPEERLMDLLFRGFKIKGRFNYRDMLITLLLNGAGFRVSEAFHLYLWDVMEDPAAPGSALVLIHHPAWGAAPNDSRWVDRSGYPRKGNRAEYLAEMFGLPPRDWVLGSHAAGWKGGMHETQFGG